MKNLPQHINQDKLRELFEHHGKITKVVLPPAKPGQEQSRYGFVHFADRSSAMRALKNTEKYEIDGISVSTSFFGLEFTSYNKMYRDTDALMLSLDQGKFWSVHLQSLR